MAVRVPENIRDKGSEVIVTGRERSSDEDRAVGGGEGR